MQLAMLDIDAETAKAGLDEYNAALRVERNAEDEAIAAAYRAAARGLPVISLSAAVAAGGFFPDNGLPRIAICRADATQCTVERSYYSGSHVTFFDEYATGRPTTAMVGANHVMVGGLQLPSRVVNRATTVVPPVPPRFRPKRRNGNLRRYHILWEVEKWDPTPPRDPALLRHIRGDLWAVLACWDLTDVERHVLGQRMPVRP
jgi:hypothetical protein